MFFDVRGEFHEKLDDLLLSRQKLSKHVSSLQTDITRLQALTEVKHIREPAVTQLRQVMESTLHAVFSFHEKTIISALQAPYNNRFDNVGDADETTFRWVFSENFQDSPGLKRFWWTDRTDLGREKAESLHWDRLSFARNALKDWAERGDGFFYISGKPGAGKSTLMKYLCCHPQLMRMFRLWADSSELVFAKFFIWKPGQDQNNWNALLRNIISQILSHSPELTRIAFPEEWKLLQVQPHSTIKLETHDIRQALDNIFASRRTGRTYKFVLFIDGLDEFNGNHFELTRTLKEWVEADPGSLKICFSSREWNVFTESFSTCPKLKVHEVTGSDIGNLVSTKLQSNPHWQALEGHVERRILLKQIITKAEGVFLWTTLVLHTLEDALANGDDITDLQRKIDSCPAELEDLFHHLFTTIHKDDREWAFKALCATKAQKVLYSANMSLFQFSFFDNYSRDPDFALKQLTSSSEDTDVKKRLDRARRQVYGRCRGFLEVRQGSHPSSPSRFHSRVLFTHRSIIEFLELPEIENHMKQYLDGFDPFDAYCQTFLAQMKASGGDYVFGDRSNEPVTCAQFYFKSDLHIAFVLAFRLQRSSSPRWFTFLDAANEFIVSLLPAGETRMRIGKPLEEFEAARFIRLQAVKEGAHEYLRHTFKNEKEAREFFRDQTDVYSSLRWVLSSNSWRDYQYAIPQRVVLETVDYCLSHGISPDFPTSNRRNSFWHQAIWTFLVDNCATQGYSPSPLMEVFLRHGASIDFNLTIEGQPDDSRQEFFARGDGKMVEDFFSEFLSSIVSIHADGTESQHSGYQSEQDGDKGEEEVESARRTMIHLQPDLMKRLDSRGGQVTLYNLVGAWLPKHAARLQALMVRSVIAVSDGDHSNNEKAERLINSEGEETIDFGIYYSS